MKHYNLQIDPEADYHSPEDCCIIWPSGKVGYYSGDLAHRLDGPAVIESNGHKAWLIRGKTYHNNRDFQEAAGLSDEDMLAVILKYGDVL